MKVFKTPFAATGDRIAIPVVEQPSGEVSQPTGWTPDYQLPNTDPNYKPVGRDEMNGILFEITEALGQMQQFGFADWQSITGGWPIGANVRHADGYWQSLANGNTEEPGTGALWKELLFGNLVPASETTRGVIQLATTAQAQALTDDTRAITPKKLADSGAVFAGEVRVFAGAESSIPAGWLPCNGAAISRTTYSRLFAVIGTTYGSGNGSTTFNLPDLRGEFIRGLDNGRGVDAGRGIGSHQMDALQDLTGSIYFRQANFPVGITNIFTSSAGVFTSQVRPTTASRLTGTSSEGATGDIHFNASNVARTSFETRPRNVAMNYIIKY